ncbi:MAG: tetratricopeptide repeat protein [Phycisphaerae bacterium]|nr:tetratricopeptide repeat protein [Phycisphaerae bacterium]
MSSAAPNRVREAARAKLINLIAPGVGLVLVDRLFDGLLTAGAFGLSAGALLVATLVAPMAYSGAFRAFLAVAMVATYGLAQIAMERAAAARGRSDAAAERRALLQRSARSARYGDYASAIAQISEALEQSPEDLALRADLAILHDRAGNLDAARAAWRRVRELDRHRVYKEQIEAAEGRALNAAVSEPDEVQQDSRTNN